MLQDGLEVPSTGWTKCVGQVESTMRTQVLVHSPQKINCRFIWHTFLPFFHYVLLRCQTAVVLSKYQYPIVPGHTVNSHTINARCCCSCSTYVCDASVMWSIYDASLNHYGFASYCENETMVRPSVGLATVETTNWVVKYIVSLGIYVWTDTRSRLKRDSGFSWFGGSGILVRYNTTIAAINASICQHEPVPVLHSWLAVILSCASESQVHHLSDIKERDDVL